MGFFALSTGFYLDFIIVASFSFSFLMMVTLRCVSTPLFCEQRNFFKKMVVWVVKLKLICLSLDMNYERCIICFVPSFCLLVMEVKYGKYFGVPNMCDELFWKLDRLLS